MEKHYVKLKLMLVKENKFSEVYNMLRYNFTINSNSQLNFN